MFQVSNILFSLVSLQECSLEDGIDENEQATSNKKSSKDKKSANGQVNSEANLMFKLSHKLPYKTVFKGNFYIFLLQPARTIGIV